MSAKDYVEQIKKIDLIIANKIIERKQLEKVDISLSAPLAPDTGVRVQSSGDLHRMETAVIHKVDALIEITREINELAIKRQEIIATIEQLKPEEYDVLHRLYVQSQPYDEVASAYGKSYSWATTKHGRALASLERILRGKEDEKRRERS